MLIHYERVVSILGSVESLMPLHSAIASARLKSYIAVDSNCWSWLSQGIFDITVFHFFYFLYEVCHQKFEFTMDFLYIHLWSILLLIFCLSVYLALIPWLLVIRCRLFKLTFLVYIVNRTCSYIVTGFAGNIMGL